VVVRGTSVVWGDEVVSLAHLEEKAREFMESVRSVNAKPMVALASNKDVPHPKGIAVLKILSNAGITKFAVVDPVSRWMEKGKAN